MVIPIQTTKKKYFRQCLEVLKILPPLNTLRPKELTVLAEFLYWNNEYKHIPKEDRWKIIFDYETKLKMKDNIGIDDFSFNNITTSLRKKGILSKKGIENTFGIDADKPFIKFEFAIQ